jgi:hypothetical protein
VPRIAGAGRCCPVGRYIGWAKASRGIELYDVDDL